ncbi:MAG: hypothetical protein EOO09_19115 [Chitinophagaceae bacterium]|nr:MAG: hypothetical protein EOO09_19115 [Chitinophagaceae bacterium]
MALHLKIAGAILVFLALVHVVFPIYFKWKEELQRISLINRQLIQVHTFFIALTVFLMGLLALSYPDELQQAGMGTGICLALGLFWSVRFVIQFTGYSSRLWKGKRFETIVHVLFAFIWAYLSFVFLNIYFLWV